MAAGAAAGEGCGGPGGHAPSADCTAGAAPGTCGDPPCQGDRQVSPAGAQVCAALYCRLALWHHGYQPPGDLCPVVTPALVAYWGIVQAVLPGALLHRKLPLLNPLHSCHASVDTGANIKGSYVHGELFSEIFNQLLSFRHPHISGHTFWLRQFCVSILGTSITNVADTLASRRLLDVEGWTNDITLLRKALEATDRKLHQMRLSSRLPGAIASPTVLTLQASTANQRMHASHCMCPSLFLAHLAVIAGHLRVASWCGQTTV